MKKRITSALLILAVALSFSTQSFAQSKTKRIETARSAPISLIDGIKAVEERMNGSVVEAEITRKSKRDLYDLYVVANNSVYEVYIDITDGKLVKQELTKKKAVQLNKPLVELIEMAVKIQPGVPFEAECNVKRKSTTCEISIVAQNNDVYDVTLDGSTGDVISIELD